MRLHCSNLQKGSSAKKVKLKDFGPGPWTPEQIREYERQRVEWNREVYKIDLLKWRKWLEKNYKCERSLELVFRTIQDARDLSAIPFLIKVLKYNPRGINRAEAAQVIKWIEKYNHDKSAFPALVEALDDTVIDVQEKVADALVALGDTIYSLKVLEKLAEGKGKKHWTADWAGYMELENMNEREIEKEKKKFRDNLQFNAINLLGKIGTEKAIKILEKVEEYNSQEWVRKHAGSVLEKVMAEKTREGERK